MKNKPVTLVLYPETQLVQDWCFCQPLDVWGVFIAIACRLVHEARVRRHKEVTGWYTENN